MALFGQREQVGREKKRDGYLLYFFFKIGGEEERERRIQEDEGKIEDGR